MKIQILAYHNCVCNLRNTQHFSGMRDVAVLWITDWKRCCVFPNVLCLSQQVDTRWLHVRNLFKVKIRLNISCILWNIHHPGGLSVHQCKNIIKEAINTDKILSKRRMKSVILYLVKVYWISTNVELQRCDWQTSFCPTILTENETFINVHIILQK